MAIARAKAEAAAVDIEWVEAMGDRVDFVADDSATKVVSSLVLHQCDLTVKEAILSGGRGDARGAHPDRLDFLVFGAKTLSMIESLRGQAPLIDERQLR